MVPSPFHGIFKNLGADLGMGNDEEFLSEMQKDTGKKPQRGKTTGQVAVDIFELDNYYIIKVPIAGVRLCDLDIETSDNTLIIRGMRRQTDEIPSEQYYLQECYWGEFERKVQLPCTIDPRKVRATFNKEGILKIIIPKEDKVKIVRISEG